jgi:ABC-type glycerol-3-phosphate transport system permease component
MRGDDGPSLVYAVLPAVGNDPDLMAAALVSSVLVVLLYLVFQRYLVHGLAAGAFGGT